MPTFNRCLCALLAALIVAQVASAFSLTDLTELSSSAKRRLSRSPPPEHPPPDCNPHLCPFPPQCYVNTCNDNKCDILKVPDHTECYDHGKGLTGKCIDGHCEFPPSCHPADCPQPHNPCEKAICDGHECSSTHVPDHTVCHLNGKDGKCVSGHCEVPTCKPEECPKPDNPCEKAICDGHECSTTHVPDHTVCHLNGKDGKCVGGHCEIPECHPDSCPKPHDPCKVAVCKNHACAEDSAPQGTVCYVPGAGQKHKGTCEHGFCNPDYIKYYNKDDDDGDGED